MRLSFQAFSDSEIIPAVVRHTIILYLIQTEATAQFPQSFVMCIQELIIIIIIIIVIFIQDFIYNFSFTQITLRGHVLVAKLK